MAETEKTVVEANAVNPQADAPKKNAVPSETSPLSNSAEDLGPAVVKPTDSNPDATKNLVKFRTLLMQKQLMETLLLNLIQMEK
jgi:hypothetical protein